MRGKIGLVVLNSAEKIGVRVDQILSREFIIIRCGGELLKTED